MINRPPPPPPVKGQEKMAASKPVCEALVEHSTLLCAYTRSRRAAGTSFVLLSLYLCSSRFLFYIYIYICCIWGGNDSCSGSISRSMRLL